MFDSRTGAFLFENQLQEMRKNFPKADIEIISMRRADTQHFPILVSEVQMGRHRANVVHVALTDDVNGVVAPVAALLVDLDVTKTHSRPHVSDDNPYSEAQFKTLKYRPDFPERFGSLEDARAHCQQFFHWYNGTHRHSGIGFMTPEVVHYGRAQAMFQNRADTLNDAFLINPKRFKGNVPQPPKLPTAAWINPPKPETADNTALEHSTLNKCILVSQSH